MNTGPNSVSNDDSPQTDAVAGKLPDVVLDVVAGMVADIHRRVTQAVTKTETQYIENLHQVLASVQETLRLEMKQELQAEFEARLQSSLAAVQQQFQEELERKTGEFANELDYFRRHAKAASAEIEIKEAELAQLDRQADALLEDPDAELSKMIRNNAARNELRTYIKALRSQAGAKPEK